MAGCSNFSNVATGLVNVLLFGAFIVTMVAADVNDEELNSESLSRHLLSIMGLWIVVARAANGKNMAIDMLLVLLAAGIIYTNHYKGDEPNKSDWVLWAGIFIIVVALFGMFSGFVGL